MEDRLKERLTGAVLLVVLVVVLVPAMFRGERPGNSAVGGAAPQVYTIDLKGAAPAVQQAPVEAGPLPAQMPASEEPLVTPAAPAVQAAPEQAAQTLPPAPVRPAAPPASKTTAPAVTRSPPASGGFAVQVGSFTSRDNASMMVRQAAKKGVRLVVAGPDDRGLFRVRTAAVRTRQDAVALQETLRKQGYKGLVSAVN